MESDYKEVEKRGKITMPVVIISLTFLDKTCYLNYYFMFAENSDV